MSISPVAVSPSLLEANRLLQIQQAQTKARRLADGGLEGQGKESFSRQTSPDQLETAITIISTLPKHLGWSSASLTALVRQEKGEKGWAEEPVKEDTAALVTEVEGSRYGEKTLNVYANATLPHSRAWVKLYPGIGLAMLRRGMTAPGRLWLMLRLIDKEGQGRISVEKAKELLVAEGAPLKLCGQRQWRNLLRVGEGVFWTRDRESLWLCSATKVALALGVNGLTGHPVALPVEALREGVGAFRAHLYAAFHSGRAKETPRGRQVMPIARVTLAGLSGVGASSQRAYEKQTKMQVQPNFAVGEVATEENRENRVWAQGQAVFELTDHRGQQGKKGETYLAWQLPNCYLGQLQHRPKGRQKRINRELKDLVMQGMPGNVGRAGEMQSPEKRYYPNGKEGVRGCGRGSGQDFYWPGDGVRNRLVRLWQQMAND